MNVCPNISVKGCVCQQSFIYIKYNHISLVEQTAVQKLVINNDYI